MLPVSKAAAASGLVQPARFTGPSKPRARDLQRWEEDMKKLIALASVLIVAHAAYAMLITPPEMVLRQVIKSATPKKLPRALDIKKIYKANTNHTERYVSDLILSLKTEDLKIRKPKETQYLTVHVLAPRKVAFLFEARHSKWMDGGDYTYYVIIGIKEKDSQSARGGLTQ